MSVIVSAPPLNEKMRSAASRLSLTGSSPVKLIVELPSITLPELALSNVCVMVLKSPLDEPFSSTSLSPEPDVGVPPS